MFNDCECINYWFGNSKRFSTLIDLVISGINDKNKNVYVTAISFCSNLTLNGLNLIKFEYNVQWIKLLECLITFIKTVDQLDNESSFKISISFYRLIKDRLTEHMTDQIKGNVQEISDIIYYWNIDDNLKISIKESLENENENEATKDKFEVDYGFDE